MFYLLCKYKKIFIYLFFVLLMPACDHHKKLTSYFESEKEIKLNMNQLSFIQDISFLFIIDASFSMNKSRETLSENIETFLTPLFSNYPNYNYNFAITTMSKKAYFKSDLVSVSDETAVNCELNIDDFSKFSYDTDMGSFLHYSFEDLKTIKQKDIICMISYNLETVSGGSNEPFFDSLFYIVEKSQESSNSKFGKQFFNENNFLILFFLSDQWGEFDAGYGGTENEKPTVMEMKNLADNFSEDKLKQLALVIKKDHIRTYAVVLNADNHQRRLCGHTDNGAGSTLKHYPYHLYSLIKKTGGFRLSICDPSWGAKLTEMFDDLETAFIPHFVYLDEVPKIDTIEVFVNNKKVHRHTREGWFFNSEDLSINIGPGFSYADYRVGFNHKDDELKVRYYPVNVELLKED